MEIRILKKDNADLTRKFDLVWKKNSKRVYLLSSIILVVGLVLVIFKGIDAINGGSFWQFESAFGFLLIYAGILTLGIFNKTRSKAMVGLQKYVNKFEGRNEGVEIVISDSGITYRDFEANSVFKWSRFCYYQVLSNNIIIYTETAYLGAFIFDDKEMTPEQFTELTGFIKKQLPSKDKTS